MTQPGRPPARQFRGSNSSRNCIRPPLRENCYEPALSESTTAEIRPKVSVSYFRRTRGIKSDVKWGSELPHRQYSLPQRNISTMEMFALVEKSQKEVSTRA